jgi:hypothetical protein
MSGGDPSASTGASRTPTSGSGAFGARTWMYSDSTRFAFTVVGAGAGGAAETGRAHHHCS